MPDLAIVPSDLYAAVEARKQGARHVAPTHLKRPKYLLSGLLRCSGCGGGMSNNGRDRSGRMRIRCSAARESGTCPDPRTYYLDEVERAVLSGLRDELRAPTVLAEFVREYRLSLDRGEPTLETPSIRAGPSGKALALGVITSAPGSAGSLIVPDYQRAPIMLPHRAMTVRQLLQPGRTAGNLIYFVRQTGFVNNAAVVAELAQKPESNIVFAPDTAPVRTIAHWVPVSRQAFDDVPGMESLIDGDPPPNYAPLLATPVFTAERLFLIGYSAEARAMVGYYLQAMPEPDLPAWTVKKFTTTVVPTSEVIWERLGSNPGIPSRSRALRIMERQRDVLFDLGTGVSTRAVGGFCLETVCTPEGIRSSVIRRWPDRIGEPLAA